MATASCVYNAGFQCNGTLATRPTTPPTHTLTRGGPKEGIALHRTLPTFARNVHQAQRPNPPQRARFDTATPARKADTRTRHFRNVHFDKQAQCTNCLRDLAMRNATDSDVGVIMRLIPIEVPRQDTQIRKERGDSLTVVSADYCPRCLKPARLYHDDKVRHTFHHAAQRLPRPPLHQCHPLQPFMRLIHNILSEGRTTHFAPVKDFSLNNDAACSVQCMSPSME